MKNFNPLPLYRGRRTYTWSKTLPAYFNPLPLYRGRPEDSAISSEGEYFNPLPLYRGRDTIRIMPQQYRYFNPLPLYRGRPPVIGCNFLPAEFQSTSSIQRKTSISAAVYPDTVFQSTSSIQRKTRGDYRCRLILWYFNPLPLYRGRRTRGRTVYQEGYFNPLPLYRGRPSNWYTNVYEFGFQSTSSIQRKTPSGKHRGGCGGISIHFLYTQEDYALLEPIYFFCISIHFLYTEEDHSGQREWLRMDISIHFLYTEEDLRNTLWIIFIVLFQSTSSIQRKTRLSMNRRSS